MRSILLWGWLATWTMLPVQSRADRLQNTPAIDLTALTLEDLMNIEVTLASRKEEKLFKTAAAISVLTRDDLRRSGATSIAEALRLVPGMQVGRIDANKWAIGARGFNFRFSNKLLVLVDGRSVYTPLFSGVFWEIQDLVLEDVERIEVIRGPGATLWGANAVNGIINIVTANTAATQGGLVEVSSGSEERGLASLRYGGSFAAETTYRAYAKFIARDAFTDASGTSTADAWDMQRTGFRIDWKPTPQDALSWQGALYNGQTGQTYRIPTLVPPFLDMFDDDTDWLGGHLQTHWRRTWSQEATFDLQLYYNRERSSDRTLTQEHDTYDLDLQHRFAWGARHDMVWGLGYRFTADDTEGSFKISFDPASRNAHLFSAFAQDQINLIPQRLRLTLGSKFERNVYSGFEYQPNMRLLWTPHLQHTLWGAVSRAVRTPARADDDVRIAFRTLPTAAVIPDAGPEAPPILTLIQGDRAFKSEKLRSYEIGYRVQPHTALFFDLATFYNDYDDLRTSRDFVPSFQADAEIPHFTAELTTTNLMYGKAYGGELAAEWHLPRGRGRLRAAHSYLKIDLRLRPGANPENETRENGSPQHQFYLWPSLNLRPNIQLDVTGRYVSRITDRNEDDLPLYADYLPGRDIAAYFELDLRLAWQPVPHLEIAVVGQNLLDNHHPEFVDLFVDTLPTQVQRGAYATVAWKF